MTRGELMRRLSARELVEWQIYYTLEPFGAERDAAHAGIIASTVANFSGHSKSALKPSDFIVQYDQIREHEMTREEQAAVQMKRERELFDYLRSVAVPAKAG